MKKLIKSIIKTFLFFDLSLIVINYLPEISDKNPAVSALKNSGICLAVVLGLTLIYILLVEKRQVCVSLKKPISAILKGIFFGAFLPIVTVALTAFLGKIKISDTNSIENIALWILALFVTCVTNELLLRGYLFSLFKKHFGLTAAVISSTVLFCAIDLNIFSYSKIYIANLLLFNILLCFILNSAKTIIASIFARFTFLTINTVLLGSTYPQSGYPSLYNITFKGNVLLNGGEYGIMGSVLMMIILIAVCLILIYKAYNLSENFKNLHKFIKRF